jgi:ATP-binding cassette, subfamily B, bacterial
MATPRRAHARASGSEEPAPSFQERLQALRLVPPFFRMVWRTRPSHALGIVVCRVLSAFGPVALLWVGKLIVDGVVPSIGAPTPDWRRSSGWSRSSSRSSW